MTCCVKKMVGEIDMVNLSLVFIVDILEVRSYKVNLSVPSVLHELCAKCDISVSFAVFFSSPMKISKKSLKVLELNV